MGGAVSSGRDNNELIDNLMGGNYIRTRTVERVFRVLDRADYMTPEARDQAYKDVAWRNGPLHMSAPCIYSEVLEGLELKPGLSFLNVGSGTGYFSTLVGLIIGSSGINHGVEVYPNVVEYSIKKLSQFIENSPTLDEFDFGEPKFYCGNGLCLAPLQAPYDRVYCGAGCPEEYQNYFKQLMKVGGILVMPLNDNLVQVKRTGVDTWTSKSLLNVSFATLRVPTEEEAADLIRLDEQCPSRLQVLARAVVRAGMRESLLAKNPHLREPPPHRPAPANSCPRRICIPIEDDSDVEGLNALHDLDNVSGANEMNALLSLVLSMGQNRVAGALRFDSLDSPSDSSEDDREENDEDGNGNDGDGDDPSPPDDPPSHPQSDDSSRPTRSCRGLLTFEFQDDQKNASTSRDDGAGTSDDTDHTYSKTDTNTTMKKGPDMCGVPAEVEICLGKETASTSREMEWESPEEAPTETKAESSSEEETTETSKEQKRKKLDSGIGEGTTTSSGSSPVKSEKSEESDDVVRSDNLSDDVEGENIGRRRQKRSRCSGGPQSVSSTECEGSGNESSDSSSGRRRCKRRAAGLRRHVDVLRPRRHGADARRVRLSILMKRGVKELPLPYALKKYVNLGRCFEF